MHAKCLAALAAVAGMLVFVLAGCGASPSASFGGPGVSTGAPGAAAPSGEFGATTGGVKDMKLARELTLNGQVPPAGAFVVEGMFSEHDLPVPGAPCTSLLCLRAAGGVAPDLSGTSAGWVQVGMSSTVDPETFQRPTLSVVLLVDVSGSMSWSYSTGSVAYGTPSETAITAVRAVVAKLGAGDRVAIAKYADEAQQVLGWTEMADRPTVEAGMNKISGDGSTNLVAGMKLAVALAQQALAAQKTQQVRILLFTDEQPNTGGSDPQTFEGMAKAAGDAGIGLTVFGIGLGLGQDVLTAMTHLHGGNAFSLMKADEVAPLFEESWPWMVSPIAYDLSMKLEPDSGLAIAESYGFPQGTTPSAALEVSTVFLSKSRGALLVRLAREDKATLGAFHATGTLSYRTVEGTPKAQSLDVYYAGEALDAKGEYFEHGSTAKTVALAILTAGMRTAAEDYAGDHDTGKATMHKVADRAAADGKALNDADFDVEVALASDVLALMLADAPQGDLYGQR
jgi:Ca-activated chloride channel homolog